MQATVDDDPQTALDVFLQAQEIDPENKKVEAKISKLAARSTSAGASPQSSNSARVTFSLVPAEEDKEDPTTC